jgi:hypothetical protein
MSRVVVGKLHGGEMEVPVVLKRVAVMTEASKDGFVGVLGLAVRLRMICRRHVEFGAGELREGLPKGRREARVPVRYDLLRPAV